MRFIKSTHHIFTNDLGITVRFASTTEGPHSYAVTIEVNHRTIHWEVRSMQAVPTEEDAMWFCHVEMEAIKEALKPHVVFSDAMGAWVRVAQ